MQRRVERAKTLMRRTDQPLSWIAQEAGFTDQSHLTTEFRCQIGVTPGRFRAELAGKGRANLTSYSANFPKSAFANRGSLTLDQVRRSALEPDDPPSDKRARVVLRLQAAELVARAMETVDPAERDRLFAGAHALIAESDRHIRPNGDLR
jgi:Helix-turn-helix domain